jgi:hypothetical protein
MALKFLELNSNYFFAASVAVATAAAESTTTAAESTTAAAESTTTAAESTTAEASSAEASAFLHDTTVKTATAAKLKNTFFILI